MMTDWRRADESLLTRLLDLLTEDVTIFISKRNIEIKTCVSTIYCFTTKAVSSIDEQWAADWLFPVRLLFFIIYYYAFTK